MVKQGRKVKRFVVVQVTISWLSRHRVTSVVLGGFVPGLKQMKHPRLTWDRTFLWHSACRFNCNRAPSKRNKTNARPRKSIGKRLRNVITMVETQIQFLIPHNLCTTA